MSEVLAPYTRFDTEELASILHEQVRSSEKQLRRRRMLGVIARYGKSLDLAKEKVEKGQNETNSAQILHFAVVDSVDSEVKGQASVYPGLPLVKSHIFMNPRLLPRGLKTSYPFANPNVAAWTPAGNEALLTQAYRDLRGMTHEFIPDSGVRDIAWTIEPVYSPRVVRDAIMDAGFNRANIRFYHDGETRLFAGPSILYTAGSEWVLGRSVERELITGDWHGSTEELRSRNPRGV